MFKKHALQVKVVKDPTVAQIDEPKLAETADKLIDKISHINVTRLAIGFVAVYAAVVGVNTASEIAINIAPKN